MMRAGLLRSQLRSEIRDHIVGFYESLLGTEEIVSDLQFTEGHVVSAEEMGDLLCSPSKEDIRRTVFSISVNKSPGPNGFGSLFFRDSWDVVRDDVVAAV